MNPLQVTKVKFFTYPYNFCPLFNFICKIWKLLQDNLILRDSSLRELAENIAGRDMEAIALQYLGFEAAKIRNISDASRDDREKFNFELLNLWGRKMGNNKQVT